MLLDSKVGVVIPSFKVTKHIQQVITTLPAYIDHVIVVDDKCPDGSGEFVKQNIKDKRVVVLTHEKNQGVGGAMVTGYKYGLEQEIDILIKMDGDGQMDPNLLPRFIEPLAKGEADYTKGNRFYWFDGLKEMPTLRLAGNSGLSFINKLSSGYWDIMDPTNGYTAIRREALLHIPLEKLEKRYFFESDMLFRLGLNRFVVTDIPMEAKYADEKSNLSVTNTLLTFPAKYIERVFKRVIYLYFLRDFNSGSVSLLMGLPLFVFGVIFGLIKWCHSLMTGQPTPNGTLFIIALCLIFGIQFLLSFITFDVQNATLLQFRKRKAS